MVYNKIRELIGQADAAIREGRFDDLAEFYTDDAVLVVRPGMEAHGKDEIKRAFMAIARYFNGSVSPRQGNMVMLEAGDTVLVLSQTFVDADRKPDSEYPSERRATYVYRNVNGRGSARLTTPTAPPCSSRDSTFYLNYPVDN